MIKFIKKNLFFFLIALIFLSFFQKTILSGLLPIPSDTIVGLYYPFRDIYAKDNPNGVPFKNYLITDPVRQSIPWKTLAVLSEKKLFLPLWNPYNFSGTPLLANFQSGSFYFLNLVFLMFSFADAWSLFIIAQPLLAGLFVFLFLNNLKLKKHASLLGSIVFSFSGFSIAWLEWGNVLHTALWLPLVLLSVDKILDNDQHKPKTSSKQRLVWSSIFIFSLISSFFAGHLQIFFYLAAFAFSYFIFRWFENGRKLFYLLHFLILAIIFLLLTFIQWYPTLQFILLSARNADLIDYNTPGWFIPWQNLIQFIVPDFFGNPSTLNYTGVWNYAEFVGYVGIFPLIAALYAIFFRRDRNSIFFTLAAVICLLLAVSNPLSKIPFRLNFPFISTSQPTRLIFLIDFCLATLSAFGLDYYSKQKKGILYLMMVLSFAFISIWTFVLFGSFKVMFQEDLIVARQNLFLPTVLFMITFVIFVVLRFLFNSKNKKLDALIFILLFGVVIFDLFRFGWKFEAFSRKEYLFPSTPAINFLQKQKGIFRVSSADSRIFPPNFSIIYRLQTPDGYDPLYLSRYGEFAVAYARNKPDISAPFGFNRIITLQDYKSRLSDFLGVKYVFSFYDPNDPKFTKVFTDGKIQIYENSRAFPRAFFVTSTLLVDNKQAAINAIMNPEVPLDRVAILENVKESGLSRSWSAGTIEFTRYTENNVLIKTTNGGDGFLVLTDAYYPVWRVKIDGKPTEIYMTDYAFRGIVVPKGQHIIEFYTSFSL